MAETIYNEKTGDLITYLKTFSAITDLVGSGTSAKIYPDAEPQGSSGYAIAFIVRPGTVYRHHDGELGMRHDVVHMFAIAATRSGSIELDRLVHYYLGDYDRSDMGATSVEHIRATDTPFWDHDEPKRDASASRRYWVRRVYDFIIQVTPPVPVPA